MIKVIQVSSDTNIGGAGKCILTFLKFFDREKFETVVVVPKKSLLIPLIETFNVKVIEVEGIEDKSFSVSAIGKLKKVFKEENADIIHAHASLSAKIAGKLLNKKVIYTRHSVFEPSRKISKGIGKIIAGVVNNFTADRIIAVAEAAKDNLLKTGADEKKITVILNGVEPLRKFPEEEKIKIKESFGLKKEDKTVVIAARLTEVKGHKYFVDAAETLKNQGIKAKFLIAGTGDEEENIKRQIEEKGLKDDVLLLGFIKDMESLMNITDIQANCSFGTEATSLALLEGMSLKIPAVVTDFGGNPGVIKDGENGYLVPTFDYLKMAEKIKQLLEDDELYKKMQKSCEKIYKEAFTAEIYTRNIEKVYEEVGGYKNGK